MRKKFSFNKLLHNDRVMIAVSVVLAIVLWSVVVYGPSATDKKTITVPVTVRLNAAAESGQTLEGQHFSVISKSVDTVEVTVSGNRSVLSKLNADSLSVTADLSGVVNAVTDKEYPLEYRSNVSGAFTVINISKSRVKVTCDYIGSSSYPVSVDISNVSVEDETQYQLGSPVLEDPVVQDGQIVITGPKKIRDKIASVVARVEKMSGLNTTTVVPAEFKLLDEKGKELSESDWEHCSIEGATDGRNTGVTVIVQGYRKKALTPTLINIPHAYKGVANLVTLTPSEIEFKGAPDAVEAFEKQLNNLTIDFKHLYPVDGVCTIPLDVPEGITVVNDVDTLQATIDLGADIDTKTFELTLDTELEQNGTTWKSGNVTISNVPKQYEVALSSTKLAGVVLVGKADSISKLTEGNLSLEIDMKDHSGVGPAEYTASVNVTGSQAVWVYYGDDENSNGYMLDITVSKVK